jgi:hypothetical protein
VCCQHEESVAFAQAALLQPQHSAEQRRVGSVSRKKRRRGTLPHQLVHGSVSLQRCRLQLVQVDARLR